MIMEKITGNEPAQLCTTSGGYIGQYSGLTIRQHFAAMAMQGMLSNHLMIDQFSGYDVIALEATKFSDALIAALNTSQ